MNVIAIDPGKTGAVAAYSRTWVVHDCPTVEIKSGRTKKEVADPTLMAALLWEIVRGFGHREGQGDIQVFIEKVHAMPKQGVSSSFNFGMGYGAWQGIIAAMQLSVTFVTPQAWGEVMLQGMAKGDKQAGRLRALQLFPYLAEELKLKKNDGRGDALCIGEYGRRTLDG